MLKWAISGLCLLALMKCATAAQIGDWSVTLFPNDSKPTGCIMGGSYKDGTRLSIIVGTDYSWAIGFANQSWKLAPNQFTQAALYIDGKFVESDQASHVSDTIALLPLTTSATYRALQQGRQLYVRTPYGDLSFSLPNTAAAMRSLLDCARVLSKPNSENANVAQGSASQGDFQLVPVAEESAMLANILSDARAINYKIDPPPGGNSNPAITFNLQDGSRGLFMASRGQNTASADDYAIKVTGEYSKLCAGDFISGKKPIATSDGSVVRQILMSCKLATSVIRTESTVVRRADGFLMELSVSYSDLGSMGQSPERVNDEDHGLVEAAMHYAPK